MSDTPPTIESLMALLAAKDATIAALTTAANKEFRYPPVASLPSAEAVLFMSRDGLIGLCKAINVADMRNNSHATVAIFRQIRCIAAHEADPSIPAPPHMACVKDMFAVPQAEPTPRTSATPRRPRRRQRA